MNKCVFFDRDGTINIDSGYVYLFEQFVFMPNVIKAVEKLKKTGFLLIVITNQSGVARGYYSKNNVEELHKKINEYLNNEINFEFDGFYYCPHHKNGIIKEYSFDCNCRKPKPGMILKAKEDFEIDLKRSFFIGNSTIDRSAAEAAGISRTFLLNEIDILSAVDIIIKNDGVYL